MKVVKHFSRIVVGIMLFSQVLSKGLTRGGQPISSPTISMPCIWSGSSGQHYPWEFFSHLPSLQLG